MSIAGTSGLVRGLLPEDPFVETYVVRPGGATVLALGSDERVTVVDTHGSQIAEVSVLGADGRDDAAALDALADAPATVIRAAMAERNGSLLAHELGSRGLDPADALAIRLFGDWSPAGSAQTFRAERAVTVVVAAPAGRIVDGAPPPSELLVEVRRVTPRTYEQQELPPPLAEPRLDFRVDAAAALAYEVRAGEFIQVIDVEGKQCSDFLAFHRRKLETGLERGLDATTTRSLMGQAYPQPGLQGKFYDVDQDPLIEVVRDTVGRHDTFGLACTAKYYEDRGYPGHVNCSENFNGEVTPFGIAPRMGWEALNFFYNTGFDANNVFVMDEPWSRPGDYVLLRAMSDLVCASSACPDDIDPANGWQITPIHVRVYAPDNTFSVAIARRVTADADPVLTRETTFHPRTSELTKSFVEYRGYWLPHCFDNEGAIAEYWACREKVAIMDLSPLRKWEVLGPDAETLIQHAITRDARRLSVGQVTYTALCNETGGMIDDATVYRLGQDNFRFVGGDEYDGIWLNELREKLDLKVWVKPSTDQLHNVAVQGPESRELLKKIVWTPPTQTSLEDLKWFRFTVGRIGTYDGIPIVVSRTGYTGELGYEVWCHPSDGPSVWDAIWAAGAEHGLTPLGLEALDILRIESGLIFAGYEFDDQVDPFEAGVGLRRRPSNGRRLRGARRAGGATRASAARPRRPRARRERDGRPRRRDLRRPAAGRRRHERDAEPDPEEEHRARTGGGAGTSELGTALEVGKLDGLQKRISATVVRYPLLRPRQDEAALLIDELTAAQIESFERDGFLIVDEGLVSERGLELLRERYVSLFDGEYETGIRPDEVNWVPGRDPEDRTRQLCNAWKSDNVVAAQVLSERTGRLAAQLAGYRGVRILQDNVLWKPPGTKAIGFHQDSSYADYLVPPEMITCWISLHETHADAGPIEFVRGSHRWPKSPPARSEFHAPDDWLAGPRAAAPDGHRARPRPGRREAGRRLLPPRPHLARLGAELFGDRRAHGARLTPRPGRDAFPRDERRRHLLALSTSRRPLARRVVLPGRLGGESGYRTPWLAELPDLG